VRLFQPFDLGERFEVKENAGVHEDGGLGDTVRFAHA
jgi:hypothetical protein